jgi:hypothetical protein
MCVMMGAALLAPCSASMHAHVRAIAATSGAALESLSTPAESSQSLPGTKISGNCPYPSLPPSLPPCPCQEKKNHFFKDVKNI